jgi:hypothetical protein
MRRLPAADRAKRKVNKTMASHISNVRPKPDKVLVDIADYVLKYKIKSAEAYDTARYCLMDTLGCGFEALEYPACTKLLGPVVPGTIVPNGAKVPGTPYQLKAAMTGSTSTTPGSPRSGVTPRTTSAASWRLPTGCRATPWPPAASRCSCRTSSRR